jgi:hypothetical protein
MVHATHAYNGSLLGMQPFFVQKIKMTDKIRFCLKCDIGNVGKNIFMVLLPISWEKGFKGSRTVCFPSTP